jgi:HK97 gp10 family phage protein
VKLSYELKIKDNINNVDKAVINACKEALAETIVDIQRDTIEGSPWQTGNNARSIRAEIDPSGLQGMIYSTSGYGGFLETGTVKMAARPYFRPALDRNTSNNKLQEKIKAKLGA